MSNAYPNFPSPLYVTIKNEELGYEHVGTVKSIKLKSRPAYEFDFNLCGLYKRFTITILLTSQIGRIEYPQNICGERVGLCEFDSLEFSTLGVYLVWHEGDKAWSIAPSTEEELIKADIATVQPKDA